MKKLIALVCVFTLLSSIPVLAAGSASAAAVQASSQEEDDTPAADTSYSDEGFVNASDSQAAASRNMSAGEYYNNVVKSAPGVSASEAKPVGQGGKILINGVPTNLTATLSRVNAAYVSSSKAQAEALGGRVFNVLDVDLPGAKYLDATINFYVQGLLGTENIVVKQYVDGQWIDVVITEIRADHVVLNLKQSGPIAFIQVP